MRREHIAYAIVAIVVAFPLAVVVLIEAVFLVTGKRPTLGILGM
jgi:hypothetical protein